MIGVAAGRRKVERRGTPALSLREVLAHCLMQFWACSWRRGRRPRLLSGQRPGPIRQPGGGSGGEERGITGNNLE